jgi:hypothetical protein
MALDVRDEADATLRSLVATNRSLARQPYFHLLRRRVESAPSV